MGEVKTTTTTVGLGLSNVGTDGTDGTDIFVPSVWLSGSLAYPQGLTLEATLTVEGVDPRFSVEACIKKSTAGLCINLGPESSVNLGAFFRFPR